MHAGGRGKRAARTCTQQGGAGRKSDRFVKVSASAEPAKPGADGRQVVTVTLAIDRSPEMPPSHARPAGMVAEPGGKKRWK